MWGTLHWRRGRRERERRQVSRTHVETNLHLCALWFEYTYSLHHSCRECIYMYMYMYIHVTPTMNNVECIRIVA